MAKSSTALPIERSTPSANSGEVTMAWTSSASWRWRPPLRNRHGIAFTVEHDLSDAVERLGRLVGWLPCIAGLAAAQLLSEAPRDVVAAHLDASARGQRSACQRWRQEQAVAEARGDEHGGVGDPRNRAKVLHALPEAA